MNAPDAQNPREEIACSNLAYAEMVYEQYLEDPSSVSEYWRAYFEASEQGASVANKH